MRRRGRPEIVFAQCAAAGFLVPWIPNLLGFRPFGRGIGGIFRTTVVSSVTSVYGATVFPSRNNPDASGLIRLWTYEGGFYREAQQKR